MLFVVLGTHSNKNVKEEAWPDLDFLASVSGAYGKQQPILSLKILEEYSLGFTSR